MPYSKKYLASNESSARPHNPFFIIHKQDYFSQPKLDAKHLIGQLQDHILDSHVDIVLDSFSFDIEAAFAVVYFLKEKQINYRLFVTSKSGSFATVLALATSQVFISPVASLAAIDPTFYTHGFPTIPGKKQYWHLNPLEFKPWLEQINCVLQISKSEISRKYLELINKEAFPPEKRKEASSCFEYLSERLLNILHEQYRKTGRKIINYFLSDLYSFDASAFFSQLRELGLNVRLIDKNSLEKISVPSDICSQKLESSQKTETLPNNQLNGERKKMKNLLRQFLEFIEKKFSTTAILLYTPSTMEVSAQITHGVEHYFSRQIISIKKAKKIPIDQKLPKITLLLSTNGGNFPASMNLVKLIRENCEVFETFVLDRALSSGSLICALSDKVYASKFAKFGPFSPLINSLTDKQSRLVSVSDVEEILSSNKEEIEKISSLHKLYESIDPIMIAQAYRGKKQILSSLKNFLANDKEKLENIVSCFLDKNKNHDEFISVDEAIKGGLNIEIILPEMEEIIHNNLNNIGKIALPVDSQEIINFYKNNNKDSYSFSLLSELTASVSGGIFSTKNDCLTVYGGEREKIPLSAISIQYSMPYRFHEVL